ncbi:MAG: CinA family protein [Actinomycetes bacterium]|jgi:nicotinamide-nucleotide amidase
MNEIAISVVKKLKKKKVTLATAESITGGGLSAAITDVAGSSDVFLGGVVTYSDKSKTKFLGVTSALLKKESAVSERVAITMAEAARAEFKSDFAIATTGVAGPGKAYGQKAGTVWIAIASKKETVSIALSLSGDRESVRNATIVSALATFERILSS